MTCQTCGDPYAHENTTDCPACAEPARYDDHQCGGLCDNCRPSPHPSPTTVRAV